MYTINLKLLLFLAPIILKAGTINESLIEYVCIDPSAENYFALADTNHENWNDSYLNPNSSNYNFVFAQNFEIDNSFCEYETTETCQTIEFPAGWTIFSTYIETENNDAYNYFAQMFIPGSQVILLDETGNACLYEWSYCTIQSIEIDEAFRIKLSEAQTREFCGTQHFPELTPITLNEGWNLMSYIKTTPADAIAVLEDFVEEIIVVKDDNGMAYIPNWNYNGIGNLEPGRGYQIKMNSSQTFTYHFD
ncbi:MAG: hypothetical protein ACI9B2_001306 [Flavobacteriales bacterium]|jgi:hypothetical protein|tara:strand:- start:3202 stop:3948 length:747 start_codon:yes stop_codon:yes gene_type:complete